MMTAALHPHSPSKGVTDVSQKGAVGSQGLGFSPRLVTGHRRSVWDAHMASLCLTLLIHPLHKSKCTRGPGLLSLFCKRFLPCSPCFPPQLGPSTVPPSRLQALCGAVLLPYVTSFSSIPVFLLHSHTLCKPGCPQLCHVCSLTAKASDALWDLLFPLCHYAILVQERDPNKSVCRQHMK